MSKGRNVKICGKDLKINLFSKGGVRKPPTATSYAKCVGAHTELKGKKFATTALHVAAMKKATASCKATYGSKKIKSLETKMTKKMFKE